MITKYHTYLAEEDPAASELLARLLEWQSTTFGRKFYQSPDDFSPSSPADRTAHFIAPHFNHGFRSKSLSAIPARLCPTAKSESFTAVVAYEDVEAAKRAKEVCDRLRCRIRDGVVFEMHLWRFDVLKTPALRDTAVKDAAQARVIMFAIRGQHELPSATKAWIELWIAQRQARPGALVLLIEPFTESTGLETFPQYKYLESVAQRARMQFFVSISKSPNCKKQRV